MWSVQVVVHVDFQVDPTSMIKRKLNVPKCLASPALDAKKDPGTGHHLQVPFTNVAPSNKLCTNYPTG